MLLILASARGVISTLVRIGWLHDLVDFNANPLEPLAGIAVTSGAELSIGLACACLATYKPLFRRFLSHGNDNEVAFQISIAPAPVRPRPDSLSFITSSLDCPSAPLTIGPKQQGITQKSNSGLHTSTIGEDDGEV